MADDDLPVLPYAGTSGWSGSEASRERVEREDGDGTTRKRHMQTLQRLGAWQERGMTWKELAEDMNWHHGQATAPLSVLHKEGRIARLTEKRDRCSVYVLPEHVAGRETAAHGRRKISEESCTQPECVAMEAMYADVVNEARALRAQLDAVKELIKPQWRSYAYDRNQLIDDLRKVVPDAAE